MIKKLQALRAKKGFTLVELVVVIAIIGVLAAILVPTMIGVVQDSRITSADSAASQIKNQTTNFLTKMDSAKKSLTDGTGSVTIDVTDGDWDVTGAGEFGTGASWNGGNDKNFDYDAYMADTLGDIKNAYIVMQLDEGKVVGCMFVDGYSSTTYNGGISPSVDDYNNGKIDWGNDGGKAGIDSKQFVVGTAPKLQQS